MRDSERVKLVKSMPTVWAERFSVVAAAVRQTLPFARIEHIGSTAVDGLLAKDVVDVLVGVSEGEVTAASATLVAAGFQRDGCRGEHHWLWWNPGTGGAVVHVVVLDSKDWTDRLRFRDILRSSGDARATYASAKVSAAAKGYGWGPYTAAKYPTIAALLRDNPS